MNTGYFDINGTAGQITNVVYGTLTLTNCTVSGNHADGSGGGLVNAFPPDVQAWNLYRPGEPFPATMTISGCTLDGNSAGGNGGAAAVLAGSLTMTGCTVNGNTAYQYGGGMYIDPAAVTVLFSTFSGNSAPLGADLYNLDSNVTLIASSVAAIYNSGGTVTDPIHDLLAQVTALWTAARPTV